MAVRVGSGTFPSIDVYLSLKSDAKVQLPHAFYLCARRVFFKIGGKRYKFDHEYAQVLCVKVCLQQSYLE